jgi:nitrogen fixation/metabolism regulation signal transduction histidine kinase
MSQQLIDKLYKREILHTKPGTANEKGTGLGLAFCPDVIEISGGKLSIC